MEDYATILKILRLYEGASGQKINFEKSSCLFSPMVNGALRAQILYVSHMQTIALSEKYLGLPTMVGRSKYGSLQSLKERVWKRVQRWKEKLLSKRERRFLSKQLLSRSLPTQCVALKSLLFYVRNYKASCANFGGVHRRMIRKFIRLIGKKCVGLKRQGV